MTLLFAAALFASAFLLFWVQPLVGKMLLPLLGGTPAVWNTCMLFFQAMLLGGYAYALALTRWLSGRAQALVHLGLLAAAALALPVAAGEAAAGGAPEGASPAWWLFATLLVTVGPPFFVLSASAPLLQRWFSRTRAASAGDPYFLYAASNAGSFFALLGFPVLLEPWLTLGQQGRSWAYAYGALALLVAACAFFALRARAGLEGGGRGGADADAASSLPSERVGAARRLRWVLLAFVPSSLVLGVTTHVTTDLVAVPLLWVIPLALYLLSFVVVFARRRVFSKGFTARLVPGTAVLVALAYLSGATRPAWFLILFHLLFLFAAALVCHGQLAEDRPAPAHLAEFYLCMALGGVLGGLFNAVVAPLAFDTILEYPLVIVLASYLRPAYQTKSGTLFGLRLGARKKKEEAAAVENPGGAGAAETVEGGGGTVEGVSAETAEGGAGVRKRVGVFDLLLPVLVGLLAAAMMLAARRFELSDLERVALALGVPLFLLNHFFAPRPLRFALGLGAVMLAAAFLFEEDGRVLHASRNFYGTHRVETDEAETLHWLQHGSTLHGKQYMEASRRCEPTSYYHREGPLGLVFKHVREKRDAGGGPPLSVAVVGLGAGTTAAYARAGEAWTFYEIDPAVVEVAREPRFFTYLSECAAAPVSVVVGDARLRLREAREGAFDLIALDAFSSDAVPAHLLTREALRLYLSKLAPGGVIAFHVSNRSIEIERVVGGISAEAGLAARIFDDGRQGEDLGLDPSTWVAVARREEDFGQLASDTNWPNFDADVYRLEVWSDDYSDILSVFNWR